MTKTAEKKNNSAFAEAWRRLKKNKVAMVAMVVVVLLLAGFLVYTFLGGTIADWMDKDKDQPGIDQPLDDDQTDENDPQQGENAPDSTPVELKMDKGTLTLEVSKSGQLTATGAEGITWASSDESVATVDATGKVTGVKAGSATITASAEGATSAACVITVNAPKKKLVLQSIYGTKDDIRKMVERMVETGKMCGGYFMCIGNHIPWNVPGESLKYYFDYSDKLAWR